MMLRMLRGLRNTTVLSLALLCGAIASDAAAQVYVANSLGIQGSLSVINSVTNTEITKIPLQQFPFAVAVHPNGSRVYVTNRDSGTVSVIDATNNTVIQTISVGAPANGITVSQDGQFFHVVAAFTVKSFSTATHVQSGSAIGLPEGTPVGIDVHPNGQFAYVAMSTLQSGSSVTVVDLVTRTVSGLAVGGSAPRDVRVRPDGKFVYATAFQDGALQVFRTSDNPSCSLPLGCPYMGGGCVHPSGCSAGAPIGVAVSPDNAFAFTANSNNQSVSIFPLDFGTGVPLPGGKVNVTLPSTGPQYLDVTPDGKFIYVSHGLNSVSVIDTATKTLVGSPITVGNGPQGVAVSPLASGPPPPPPPPPGDPTLSVTPGSFNFVGEQGLGDPSGQSAQISNTGGGTLGWSIAPGTTSGGNWLSANPGAGSAPPTASASVAAGTCGLPAGTYNGSVVVSAGGANGSPQSIPATLTVTQPGATPPLPLVRVCTDRPSYHGGDTLTLSASVRSGAGSNTGDAYIYAAVPGTTAFASVVLSQSGFSIAVGPAPVRLAQNFQAFNFAGVVLQQAFGGSEPFGTYQLTATLVQPGTDPLVPGNRIATGVSQFTLTP